MEEKYQGDFFKISEDVGIDLNKVFAIKDLNTSLEVFTDSKELSKTFITNKQEIQEFMFYMIQKYGNIGVNVMLSAGKYMDIK
ncbi:hypothetical protein ITQ94_09110 [Pediococcus pentosaceus]|uniref:hypothetical protein n=1 Tax=Pediococcus pentosaceus TaxID=1255 RepID=UPI0018FE570E|nr:hypothetical protein [Pediococcus pentosaceus]MBF7131595.1 hypothetical protein [Pediococcus pentosaceus]